MDSIFPASSGAVPRREINTSHKQKQQAELTATQPKPDQPGTKESPVFVDMLSHPKSQKEAAEAEDEKRGKARIDRWTVYIAGVGALFTGVLIIIGYRGVRAAISTLRAIEKQATLMEGQLQEMQAAGAQAARQLGLTERPWISFTANLASDLAVSEQGIVSTGLNVHVSNLGKSPAIGIVVYPDFYLPYKGGPSLVDKRKGVCERATATPGWGKVIFPGATESYTENFGFSAFPETVTRALRKDDLYFCSDHRLCRLSVDN